MNCGDKINYYEYLAIRGDLIFKQLVGLQWASLHLGKGKNREYQEWVLRWMEEFDDRDILRQACYAMDQGGYFNSQAISKLGSPTAHEYLFDIRDRIIYELPQHLPVGMWNEWCQDDAIQIEDKVLEWMKVHNLSSDLLKKIHNEIVSSPINNGLGLLLDVERREWRATGKIRSDYGRVKVESIQGASGSCPDSSSAERSLGVDESQIPSGQEDELSRIERMRQHLSALPLRCFDILVTKKGWLVDYRDLHCAWGDEPSDTAVKRALDRLREKLNVLCEFGYVLENRPSERRCKLLLPSTKTDTK